MREGKTAAFFDVDKTLLTRESAELGLTWAWKERNTSGAYLLKVLLVNQLFKRDLVSAQSMADLCLDYYKGKSLQELVEGVPAFYRDWLAPHLSPAMLERVAWHREQGHVLVILSGGVQYMLETFLDQLDFDHLLCTKLEEGPDGLLTGNADGPICIGRHKRTAAEALARRQGIDLATSYAYTDHHTDLPLLEAVGNPVAVRPTKRLRKIALQRNWKIVDAP